VWQHAHRQRHQRRYGGRLGANDFQLDRHNLVRLVEWNLGRPGHQLPLLIRETEAFAMLRLRLFLPLMLVVLLLEESGCMQSEDNKPSVAADSAPRIKQMKPKRPIAPPPSARIE